MIKLGENTNEDIAASFFDDERNEEVFFTTDQLINQLKINCVEVSESFDVIYEYEFKQMSSELSEIRAIQYYGLMKSSVKNDNVLITSGDLFQNAIFTITSAVHLLRSGFKLQPGILIRSVIEICATAFHILLDKEAFIKFESGKLESTKSVTFANKRIPIFGVAWGNISINRCILVLFILFLIPFKNILVQLTFQLMSRLDL